MKQQEKQRSEPPQPAQPEPPQPRQPAFRSLLTEKQYSQLVNKSLDSVRRDRRKGIGPTHTLVGGAVRYAIGEIERYLEGNLNRPPKRRVRRSAALVEEESVL